MEFIICDCDIIIDPDGEILPLILAIMLDDATYAAFCTTEDEDIAAELICCCCCKIEDDILADTETDGETDMLMFTLAVGLTLPFTDCITHED